MQVPGVPSKLHAASHYCCMQQSKHRLHTTLESDYVPVTGMRRHALCKDMQCVGSRHGRCQSMQGHKHHPPCEASSEPQDGLSGER